jgi:hypothetical protein
VLAINQCVLQSAVFVASIYTVYCKWEEGFMRVARASSGVFY